MTDLPPVLVEVIGMPHTVGRVVWAIGIIGAEARRVHDTRAGETE